MFLPANRCILVVDDDPGIRLLLMTYLRRRGFQVLDASNGREALERMRSAGPDLVIMDLMMPEVSGWDVLRERSGDPFLKRIPIIVVTANNVREARIDVAAQDVLHILAKPFDLDELLSRVTEGLEPSPVPAPLAA
jgi:CheY-like chemotaxis protein